MNTGQYGKSHCIVFVLTLTTLIFANQLEIISAQAFTSATTFRVSVDSAGDEGNYASVEPAISANGKFVVFKSGASNLVDDDTGIAWDVFVRDIDSGTTERVSVSTSGSEANADSVRPDISDDGRYVVFESSADNLVANDTNMKSDVFLHDRQTNQTTRVSVSLLTPQAHGYSHSPSISGDGRYIAFHSDAADLVSSDTNGQNDVFVHDVQTGETIRVSVASDGSQALGASLSPSISSDGNFVAFHSTANNLVEGDNNSKSDVFVHDIISGQTTRISVDSEGLESNGDSLRPSISDDGRHIAFTSTATNLVDSDINNKTDIFVHDRITGQIVIISISSTGVQANSDCRRATISGNGRYAGFMTEATNLVDFGNPWRDIFVHDLLTGTTERVSVAWDGWAGNQHADDRRPAISFTGRYVAFGSDATCLVGGDYNEDDDVFIRDRGSIFDYYLIYIPIIRK